MAYRRLGQRQTAQRGRFAELSHVVSWFRRMGNVASNKIRRAKPMAARASPSLRWQNTNGVEKPSCSCLPTSVSQALGFKHEQAISTDSSTLDDVSGPESPLPNRKSEIESLKTQNSRFFYGLVGFLCSINSNELENTGTVSLLGVYAHRKSAKHSVWELVQKPTGLISG